MINLDIAVLLKKMNIYKNVKNHKINTIETNSKMIKENDVFVAIKGAISDGHDYIEEAILNGAKTIFCEKYHFYYGINIIEVDDTRKCLGMILKIFYNDLTKKVFLIGVTGTNGKTTISTLLYNYFLYNGTKSILIGTEGIFFEGSHYETKNTTPDILIIYKVLNEAIKKKCKYAIMEVSSQAIKEARIYGIKFHAGIFSNLSPEHLDYHRNMTDYKYTKGHFLSSIFGKKTFIVLNHDDPTFKLFNRLSNTKVITYGKTDKSDYQAININKSLENGTSFKVVFDYQKEIFKTFLLGEFNIYNILSVFATIRVLGFDVESFKTFLKIYVKLSGRMEMLKIEERIFFIDYAHTPAGVLNVLESIKEYMNKKITVVVGCGGDRDTSKRPEIGMITTKNADLVVFTNDNPRGEDEQKILDDIRSGAVKENYVIIPDRYKAIEYAIKNSSKNDIIAVLGKGSETTQIIHNIRHPFNDAEVIKKIMKKEGN